MKNKDNIGITDIIEFEGNNGVGQETETGARSNTLVARKGSHQDQVNPEIENSTEVKMLPYVSNTGIQGRRRNYKPTGEKVRKSHPSP